MFNILVFEVLGTKGYAYQQQQKYLGTSLAVQWLGLSASTAGGMGSIPRWGTKIPHAGWRGQNKTKQKKHKGKIFKP